MTTPIASLQVSIHVSIPVHVVRSKRAEKKTSQTPMMCLPHRRYQIMNQTTNDLQTYRSLGTC